MEKAKSENQKKDFETAPRTAASHNQSMKPVFGFFRIVLALFLWAAQLRAQEATVTSLYNTGVTDQGQPLTNATVGDSHYTLISMPTGSTNEILALTTRGSWLAGDSYSDWIGPHNPGTNGYSDTDDYDPAGEYTYETTFDVNGLNSGKVSIAGRFATDNELTAVYLNGSSLGISNSDSGINAYHSWHNFTIPPSAVFKNGQNTLDFVVHNDGGPTGLRVEMTILPKLTITLSENQLVLNWPIVAVDFKLQTATNLSPPIVWSNVTAVPAILNGQNTVTNSISASQQFFRLIR